MQQHTQSRSFLTCAVMSTNASDTITWQPIAYHPTHDTPCRRSHAAACAESCCGGAGLAGLVNAALIGVVLLCLTPVFRHMPLNALAAIVITGVIGLLDFPRVLFLLKVSAWLLSGLCLGRLLTPLAALRSSL